MREYTFKDDFALRLQWAMKRADMKTAELAARADVGQKSLEKYLDLENPTLPTLKTFRMICKVLHVSADWMLFGEEG